MSRKLAAVAAVVAVLLCLTCVGCCPLAPRWHVSVSPDPAVLDATFRWTPVNAPVIIRIYRVIDYGCIENKLWAELTAPGAAGQLVWDLTDMEGHRVIPSRYMWAARAGDLYTVGEFAVR